MPSFCGLDFGTSNSTVGVAPAGKARLVAVEGDKTTIPSTLFFEADTRHTLFGRAATRAYAAGHEGRYMVALKSILGTGLMGEKTVIDNKAVGFDAILGRFIAHLRHQAAQTLGAEVDHVVMGRPVFFVDDDPAADQAAQNTLETIARAQGFKQVSFQLEPVAAALAYEQAVTSEELALVVDIGGGTADFSVMRVSPIRHKQADRTADVLSNTGIHIGGTDFDRLLSLKTVMPHFGYKSLMGDTFDDQHLEVPSIYFHDLATWQKINFLYTRATLNELVTIRRKAQKPHLFDRFITLLEDHKAHTLALAVEEAKITLTEAEQTPINLHFAEPHLAPALTRADLAEALADSTAKLQHTAADALHKAGITPNQVDVVFLTGGSTAIPHVRMALLATAPQARVVEGDRFGSIGTGLTLEALRRYGT